MFCISSLVIKTSDTIARKSRVTTGPTSFQFGENSDQFALVGTLLFGNFYGLDSMIVLAGAFSHKDDA